MEKGISNKFLPLPLNEPVVNLISPKKVEPLTIEVTTNPLSGVTDAVTEPDEIAVLISASGVSAVLGMLNNLAPLPEKEPVTN